MGRLVGLTTVCDDHLLKRYWHELFFLRVFGGYCFRRTYRSASLPVRPGDRSEKSIVDDPMVFV
jgi:hypothetical protein